MKNSFIIGLALIAVVFSFLDCTVKSEEDDDDDEQFEDNDIPNIVRKGVLQLHKPQQFLAGEDTPCWRVSPDGGRLDRIQNQPVKKAYDHWNEARGKDILWRKGRSVNSTANIPNVPEPLHPRSIEKPENITKVVRRSASTGRSSGPVQHVYPTMLVVMDYLAEYDDDRREFNENDILSRIKYALAFWNSVNIRLRRIITPIIQIRIAGIVIGNGAFRKKYSENWWRKPDESYRTMSQLFRENDVWRNEIPPSSYDFIVHMTSVRTDLDTKKNLWGNNVSYIHISSEWIGTPVRINPIKFNYVPPYVSRDAFQAYSEWKVPCGSRPQSVGDVIFWDDFNFNGVTSAVNQLIHVFGLRDRSTKPDEVYKWGKLDDTFKQLYVLLELPGCAWDLVTPGLGHAWCMSQPKKRFPPGKRVPTIMPGDIFTRQLRCVNLRFSAAIELSEECGDFVCSHDSWMSSDRYIGPDVDGTRCENNKVCVNNKCVDKTWGDE